MTITYEQAIEKLGKRESRKLGNNTYLVRYDTLQNGMPSALAVRLHGTDVVTIHSDGTYTLHSGGWHTVTTKARMNEHSPAHVVQVNYDWFLREPSGRLVPYFDGITVDALGRAKATK